MKRKILSLVLMGLLYITAYSQTKTLQFKVQIADSREPLVGATVYFEQLEKGAVTNMEGIATFKNIPDGSYSIRISFVGFKTLEEQIEVPVQHNLVFELEEDGHELEEIFIQSNRTTRTIKKIPTRVEFIGSEELSEKAFMNAANISMVLRESTGIQMQQTSLSSGNSNIRIQGLEGRYTQLLKDGFPLYGGFSSGLSIMQIPPLDMKQFEIIKGSSSTLYGGGAIAGLVNMVSKTPEEKELDIMLTQTHAKGTTGNVFYSDRKDKIGLTIYASANKQKVYDADNDGFSNLPQATTVSFNPKLFYDPSEKISFWFGINGTYDDRTGGDIVAIEKGAQGIHQYLERNSSKRLSSQAVFSAETGAMGKISIKNSFSYFHRKLVVPAIQFKGKQFNSFTEATYQKDLENRDWIFGANLYTTHFEEDTMEIPRNQSDVTFGAFTNGIFDLSQDWALEAGFRLDHSKDWGVFALPRISVLFRPNDNGFSSRLGGGLGYKIPEIFTEQAASVNYKNILPISSENLKAERSFGLNLDFNYKTQLSDEVSMSVNQLFYITSLDHSLLLTETNSGSYEFKNAPSSILSRGSETNIKFIYKDFRWYLNYALIDTRLRYLPGNPQKPLTAKHNAGSVIMYENEKWRIGYETYYTGKQQLPDASETTDFITMGLLVMRNFKWGGAFVNFENFTDRQQGKYSPLVFGSQDSPFFADIYAPTDGFIFTIGIILKPFGNKVHH